MGSRVRGGHVLEGGQVLEGSCVRRRHVFEGVTC